MTHFGLDSWSFPPLKGSSVPRAVQFTPRLVVNTVRAAIDSTVEGHGVTRLFSYHVADEIREGRLQILLGKDEHPPLPAHLLVPQGRLSVPKVRAFVDFAVPRLKRYFTRLTNEANRNADAIRSRSGRVPSE
jgi:DNA-binding transcriptional LysR family regulator